MDFLVLGGPEVATTGSRYEEIRGPIMASKKGMAIMHREGRRSGLEHRRVRKKLGKVVMAMVVQLVGHLLWPTVFTVVSS